MECPICKRELIMELEGLHIVYLCWKCDAEWNVRELVDELRKAESVRPVEQ